MAKLLIIVALIAALLNFASAAKKVWKTSESTRYIYDESNRVTIFHGTNFVNKEFPWYSTSLLNETHLDNLQSLGFNTVRLGFMWTGAEPQQGVFNETYFEVLGGIVDQLNARGIYPFIDVHQDVLSSYFCLYDGAPTWVVDKAEVATHEFPWPLKVQPHNGNKCPYYRGWFLNYFSEQCGKAFQGLYHNHNGMTDAFATFWTKVATFFRNKGILGYEIINEPWAGDIYQHPELLLPGKAGSENLQPFYDVISAAIRAGDPEHAILYEPVTWGMIFNGDIIGSGFTHVPGGDDYKTSSIFSFHYYCWWLSDSEASRKTCDRGFAPKVFSQVLHDLQSVGGSAMLTEWGQGCNPNDDPNSVDNEECYAIMNAADDSLLGWTDWYFGGHLSKDWQSTYSYGSKRVFGRTYARSIAGEPKIMQFNTETGDFHLCFKDLDSVTNRVTEVYVNREVFYPNGIDIKTSPNLVVVNQDPSSNLVYLKSISVQADVHCVDIKAKPSQ